MTIYPKSRLAYTNFGAGYGDAAIARNWVLFVGGWVITNTPYEYDIRVRYDTIREAILTRAQKLT